MLLCDEADDIKLVLMKFRLGNLVNGYEALLSHPTSFRKDS